MIPDSRAEKNRGYHNFRSLLMEALLICIIGAGLGFGVNFSLVLEVFKGGGNSVAVQQEEKRALDRSFFFPVEKQDVIELIEAGAVPVDARSRDFFAEGHIPGAQALPVDEMDSNLETFRQKIPLDSKIIVYCSGYGCPDSEDVAARLMNAGYTDVMVYEGGFPEWRDSGLPVKTGGTP
jgi:rhodanese-related sulfurtransferase